MSYEPSWNAIALGAKVGLEIQGLSKVLLREMVYSYSHGSSLKEIAEEFGLKERLEGIASSKKTILAGITDAMLGYHGGYGVEAYDGLIPKSRRKEVVERRKHSCYELAKSLSGLKDFRMGKYVNARKIAKAINAVMYDGEEVISGRGVSYMLANHKRRSTKKPLNTNFFILFYETFFKKMEKTMADEMEMAA